ncbi:MAG: hypothetical protein M1833_006299 [Piccolia ochrophora]|nr:MAG: hypothetical protein M1833_006299 [Piccolia ochrophora]
MPGRVTRASTAKATEAQVKPKAESHPQQLSSPPVTPSSTERRKPTPKTTKRAAKVKKESGTKQSTAPAKANQKRKRSTIAKPEEDINELPHNLGKVATAETTEQRDSALPNKKARTSNSSTANVIDALNDPAAVAAAQKLTAQVAESPKESDIPKKKGGKAKANAYGLTPGVTPYPDWPHPTPEECQEVNDLLAGVHGHVQAPEVVPAPSTTVSGCGEVPSILDALIRTLLSAATTGANSSRAFKGMVDTFGLLKDGIGKGSVDWDKVRCANIETVFESIKSGGLADNKSKNIKKILDLVFEENQQRRNAFKEAKAVNGKQGPRGAENETEEQKEIEMMRADQNVLSLDHLHALPSREAFDTLIKYPGIGPKTASCVLLFCMQRPSFAVDTHVFRLCQWLNWVPPKATRETTYSHCEVRVPDNLKYPLHQLLIRHGKSCPRCRAATGEGSADWDQGCPIDHLVNRTGKRKGGVDAMPTKKKTAKNAAVKKTAGASKKTTVKKGTRKQMKAQLDSDESEDEVDAEESSDLTDVGEETESMDESEE